MAKQIWTAVVGGVVAAGCAPGPAVRPLVTDRPDFTESTATVEPGRVQVEGGYTYADEEGGTSHSVGELLGRIGATERLEVRVGLNSVGFVDAGGTSEVGVEDASLGVKLALVGGDALAAAVLAGTTIPTGRSPLGGESAVPSVVLALSRGVGAIGWGGNVVAEWPEDGAGERYTDLGASLAAGVGLTDRTGLFLEVYGFRSPGRSGSGRLYLDGGLTRMLREDLQVDARVGGGEGGWFVGVGLARRW